MWKKYLKIKEAADFLGVSELTLRNWDGKGKLTAYRHPVNNYRLYRIIDLEKFIEKIDKNKPRKIKVKLIENED
ncbi:MerR family DNA-binding transcriptional regulator [Patescibacteria group bacterium]|nr:MerR family DNA-binding transcriptional regulator [Patescibacteria group bacterium]MBU4353681.1 MerR family DNA-binding transcriptional regulator [Patescibacteria group bacterium]MBU4476960.1 MerR family DNA-binding transcriptional regulator [Patescibacteria group bacterium]MCG2699024.1 MerR family DNA-binding transcriptional regulator [Candidatus Parcubacteria bacterium]